MFLGGGAEVDDGTRRNNILEYNPMSEQWQEVGTMKQGRSSHAVSVVSYKDYKDHVAGCV